MDLFTDHILIVYAVLWLKSCLMYLHNDYKRYGYFKPFKPNTLPGSVSQSTIGCFQLAQSGMFKERNVVNLHLLQQIWHSALQLDCGTQPSITLSFHRATVKGSLAFQSILSPTGGSHIPM